MKISKEKLTDLMAGVFSEHLTEDLHKEIINTREDLLEATKGIKVTLGDGKYIYVDKSVVTTLSNLDKKKKDEVTATKENFIDWISSL